MQSLLRRHARPRQGGVSSSQPQREATTPTSGRGKRATDDRSGHLGAELTSFAKVGATLPPSVCLAGIHVAEVLTPVPVWPAAATRGFQRQP